VKDSMEYQSFPPVSSFLKVKVPYLSIQTWFPHCNSIRYCDEQVFAFLDLLQSRDIVEHGAVLMVAGLDDFEQDWKVDQHWQLLTWGEHMTEVKASMNEQNQMPQLTYGWVAASRYEMLDAWQEPKDDLKTSNASLVEPVHVVLEHALHAECAEHCSILMNGSIHAAQWQSDHP
jgi:hypothetical protein